MQRVYSFYVLIFCCKLFDPGMTMTYYQFVINGTTVYVSNIEGHWQDESVCRNFGESFVEFVPGTNAEVRQIIDELDMEGDTSSLWIQTTYNSDPDIEDIDAYSWKYEKVDVDLWFARTGGRRLEPDGRSRYTILRTRYNNQGQSITGKHMLGEKTGPNKDFKIMCTNTTQATTTSQGTTTPLQQFTTLGQTTLQDVVTTRPPTSPEMTSTQSTSQEVTSNQSPTFKETTVTSPKSTPCSSCTCTCSNTLTLNLSLEEEQNLIEEIQAELVVDKKQQSKHTRKLTCAEDGRPTSQLAGVFGVALLVLYFGLIVLTDLIYVFEFFNRLISIRKND